MTDIKFLDCGSNTGQVFKWCFELDGTVKFNPKLKRPFFDIPSMKGADVFLFEPNIECIPMLEAKKEQYKDVFHTMIYNYAVLDEHKVLPFYQHVKTSLGHSLLQSNAEVLEDNGIKVQAIDISSFLSKFKDDDYIIVKIDIEESEYKVIKSLIESGQIKKINEIHVEWHNSRGHRDEKKEILNYFKENNITYYKWVY